MKLVNISNTALCSFNSITIINSVFYFPILYSGLCNWLHDLCLSVCQVSNAGKFIFSHFPDNNSLKHNYENRFLVKLLTKLSCCVGKRDYAAPECSRLANQPSSYGILTNHNAGANGERAPIAQRAQDGSCYHMERIGLPSRPGNFKGPMKCKCMLTCVNL